VAFAPDDDPWISIGHDEGLQEPEVGDIVVCTVPRVVRLIKVEGNN
jgi:hypothetical protein